MHTHMRKGVHRDQKKVSDSGAGVAGICELPDEGTGNGARVHGKSDMGSESLSHVSSPFVSYSFKIMNNFIHLHVVAHNI